MKRIILTLSVILSCTFAALSQPYFQQSIDQGSDGQDYSSFVQVSTSVPFGPGPIFRHFWYKDSSFAQYDALSSNKYTRLSYAVVGVDSVGRVFRTPVSSLPFKSSSYVPSWAEITGKPTLFSGAYSDLTGKPSLFSGSYLDLSNKPTLFSGNYSDLTGKPSLFSGSYLDLTNRPSLFSGAYSDLTGKPALFSGAYSDLTGKPTLVSYYNVSGAITVSKEFDAIITPTGTPSSGYTIDISAAGFSNIHSVTVTAAKNTNSAVSVPQAAIKSVSTTAVDVNVVQGVTLSILGATTVFPANYTGITLHVVVKGN